MRKFPQREYHILSRLGEKGHAILTYEIKPVHAPSPYLAYGLGALLAVAEFSRINADVLLADNVESAVIAMLLRKIYRTPFVFDFIDDYSAIAEHDRFQIRYGMVRFFERIVPKHADLIIVVDEHKRRYALNLRIPEKKIVLIPDGTDTEKFHPDVMPVNPIDGSTSVDQRMILYVGKINKYYRLETLIEAVPYVRKEFPDARLVLIGDGDNVEELKSLATTLGVGNSVVFTGLRDPSAIPGYIAAADVCAFPLPDSSALAIYEYMACGKPTVVPDWRTKKMGISDDLISTECVLLVADSPHSMGNGMNLLLGDEKLRAQIGRKAREFVVPFDWNNLAKQYEKALIRVVES